MDKIHRGGKAELVAGGRGKITYHGWGDRCWSAGCALFLVCMLMIMFSRVGRLGAKEASRVEERMAKSK